MVRRIVWLALAGCAPEPVDLGQEPPPGTEDDEAALRALLDLPDHFEVPAVPPFNPLTPEKIALGRVLFHDRRLSGNEQQSCADCHFQALAFADPEVTPTGSTGDVLERNSQGLANAAWLSTLTWAHDGLTVFEDQVLVPITGELPVELGVNDGNAAQVLARFDADPEVADLFADAFPDLEGATLNGVAFALASFLRTMVSKDSAYDRYLELDRAALTDQQLEGFTLFNGERFECFHCHGGVQFTASYRDADTADDAVQYPFFNNGLYNVGGDGSYPPHDQGLYELTFDPDHRGLFRPPSLRNVALTPPYMHDGSIATLEDVVRHYAAGGRVIEAGPWAGDGRVSPLKSGLVRGFEATDAEIDAVVAFLEALSDPSFLADPRFGPP